MDGCKFGYSLGALMISWIQKGSMSLQSLEMENEGVESLIYIRRGEDMEGQD